MVKPRFFDKQDEQNQIKTLLVSKYFGAWATVMLGQMRRDDDQMAYVDLFSGPGRFEDGSPSTPLLILDQAIKNPKLAKRLVTLFNDKDLDHVEQLRAEIIALPSIATLEHRPEVSHLAVGRQVTRRLTDARPVTTLFFIGPYGYKGLFVDSIGEAIQGWGCDCIFFFNYNRFNLAVTNEVVADLIDEFFGPDRAASLRQELPGLGPAARESAILRELSEALATVGGKHSLAFRFKSRLGARTSHYIVFVTKHFRGYDIMKDIMSGVSSDDGQVKRFEYVPVKASQLAMFSDSDDPYSMTALKQYVGSRLQGMTLSVLVACEKGSVDTPYTSKNVKDALIALELEERLTVDVPPSKRTRGGKVTLGDARVVTFPS